MRPVIGITTSTLDRGPEGPIQISAATHVAYARCMYEHDALPFLLPNLPEDADVDEILAHVDGLLLSGGGDIDPAWWGEAPHPAMGLIDHTRDMFEITLVRAALRRDLPVLGICRGAQVMAVATGGDLWQDIPSQCPQSIPHKQTAPRHEASHLVHVQETSLLARIIRPTLPAASPEMTLGVNSFHHQSPRNCGRMFAPVAWGPDGLIEGIAVPTATFALGVQWHPEEMAGVDQAQARIFAAFVQAAAGVTAA